MSLAIGRGGQNVRLAHKLTGWKIDIKSVSQAESMEQSQPAYREENEEEDYEEDLKSELISEEIEEEGEEYAIDEEEVAELNNEVAEDEVNE